MVPASIFAEFQAKTMLSRLDAVAKTREFHAWWREFHEGGFLDYWINGQ